MTRPGRIATLIATALTMGALVPLATSAGAAERTGTNPAHNSALQDFTVVTATYDAALQAGTSQIVVQRAGEEIPGTPAVVGNTISWDPAEDTPPAPDPASPTAPTRPPMPEGPYRALITATFTAGGTHTSHIDFVVDRTVAAPTAAFPSYDERYVSRYLGRGTVNSSEIRSVLVTGAAEAGATVTIAVDDADPKKAPVQQVVTATSSGFLRPDGTRAAGYSHPLDLSSLADGVLTATVHQVDRAGNASTAGTAQVGKDTAAPTAPTVSVKGSTGNDIRVNAADAALLPVKAVTDAGVAVAIEVRDAAGTVIAANPRVGTSDGSGAREVSLDVRDLSDGVITAWAIATDAVGNSSSGSRAANKDAVGPAAPTATVEQPINRDSASAIDVSGTTEPDGSVVVEVLGTPLAKRTVAASAAGAYTTTLDLSSVDVPEGPLTVRVTPSDKSGNVGTPRDVAAEKDTVPAQTTPVLPRVPTENGVPTVNGRNEKEFPFSGVVTAASGPGIPKSAAGDESGATVVLVFDDDPSVPANQLTPAVTRTVTTNPDGSYAGQADLAGLNDGRLVVSGSVTDRNGNTDAAGVKDPGNGRIDTTPPAGTTVSLRDLRPDDVRPDGSVHAPVTGKAEAGAQVVVTLTDGATTLPARAVVSGLDGSWSTAFDARELRDGPVTATAVATDSAGNPADPVSDGAVKDALRLRVTSRDPAANAQGVRPQVIRVAFNEEVAGTSAVVLKNSAGATIAGSNAVQDLDAAVPGKETVVFTLTNPLPVGTGNPYTVTTSAKDAIPAGDGDPDPVTDVYSFSTTGATVPPPTAELVNPVTTANAATARVSGTAPPGSDVDAVVDDTEPGTPAVTVRAVASVSGSWSTTADLTSLVDGDLTAVVTARDSSGMSLGSVTATSFKDTRGPAAPEVLLGVLNRDGTKLVVNKAIATPPAKAPLTVTAEPGASVTVTVDDDPATPTNALTEAVTATVSVGSSGSTTTEIDVSSLKDGSLVVTSTPKDFRGNTGDAATHRVDKDVEPAATPGVTLADPVTSANHHSASVSVTGTAGDALSIVVSDAGSPARSASRSSSVGSGGTVVEKLDLRDLRDGELTASVVATDAAGNPSVAGTDTAVKDATAPAVVSASPAADATTIPPATASLLFDEAPVSGWTLTLLREGSAVTGTTSTADGGKRLVFSPSSRLADGPYVLRAGVSDARGNSASPESRFTVDSVAPTATAAFPPVNAASAPDAPLTVTTEPLATVTVTVDEQAPSAATPAVTATTTADGNGVAPFALPLDGLGDGVLVANVVATDAAGNRGSTTATAVKDTTPPAAPAGVQVSPNPVNADGQRDVVVSGGAERGSSVTVTLDDADAATRAVTATVSTTSGSFRAAFDLTQPAAALADGPLTVTARATDAFGNAGAASTTSTRKDTVAPAAPALSGSTTIDAANAASYPLTGTAEPESTVTVSADDTSSGSPAVTRSVVPGADGRWSTALDLRTLFDGPIRLSAVAVDSAGNSSAPSGFDATKSTATSGGGTGDGGSGGPGTTPTETPTATPTESPTGTPTESPSQTATPTPSAEPTDSQSPTAPPTTAPPTTAPPTTAPPTTAPPTTAPPTTAPPTSGPARGSRFVVVTPTRVMDSRIGLGTTAGPKSGDVVLTLPQSIPATATSVSLNVTALGAKRAGHVTVHAAGTSLPETSNVTFMANEIQANAVVAGMSADRRVVLRLSVPAYLLVDVNGYFVPSADEGLGYVAVRPDRVLDSRDGTGTTRGTKRGDLRLVLPASVPASARAVALNLTVVAPSASGHMSAYPFGTDFPGTSNVNFKAGQIQANAVVTGVGADRSVTIRVAGASAHVVADLTGYFTTATEGTTAYSPRDAKRLVDSRNGTGTSAGRKAGVLRLTVPGLPEGTRSVLLNVAAVGATGGGYVAAYPAGTSWPGTSNVNFVRDRLQSNLVLVEVGPGGSVSLRISGASTHLVVDVLGHMIG